MATREDNQIDHSIHYTEDDLAEHRDPEPDYEPIVWGSGGTDTWLTEVFADDSTADGD